jgi:LPXTG-motif cell wall-anchored protein
VGGSISFTARTFQASSPFDFNVTAAGAPVTSGSTSADGDGVARQTITFTVVGANRVTMSGTSDQGQPLSLSVDITVTESGGGDAADGTDDPQAGGASGVPFLGGGLPRTGGDIALTALMGLALLGGGAVLVAVARKRRTS